MVAKANHHMHTVCAWVLAALVACACLPCAAARADVVTFADVSGQTARAMASTEQGQGGTRIATPYYAVFLEDALFDDGFAFEYVEYLDGAWGVLNVYASSRAQADGATAGGGLAYRLYCVDVSASTEPFAGSYATSSTLSDDGTYQVVVARPFGEGFADGQNLGASDAASGADDAAAMAHRVSAGVASRSFVNAAGGIDVATPWYTVSIPRDLFAGGWYYVYTDTVESPSGDGTSYLGRTLSVYALGQAGAAFSVCAAYGCSVPGDVVQTEVGRFSGDWEGWSVVAYRGADAGDPALLQTYAALVSVTGNPNVNPPVLG